MEDGQSNCGFSVVVSLHDQHMKQVYRPQPLDSRENTNNTVERLPQLGDSSNCLGEMPMWTVEIDAKDAR